MIDLFTIQSASANPTMVTVLYTMVLSFLLSSLVAFTYQKTFLGLSYSRNFIQAIVLSSIVAAMVMQAIGDSVGRGLGMLGAMAIVRFRTNFKDPKDIMFLFAALGSGIACGVYAWGIALAGVIGFCAVAFILAHTDMGGTRQFDGLLRFNMPSGNQNDSRVLVEQALQKALRQFALISLREIAGGERLDFAYHIKFRPKNSAQDLLKDLNAIEGVYNVQFMLQESTTDL